MKPTQDELRSLFEYDASTGILTWKDRGTGRSFRRGGKIAGWQRRDGYIHVQIGGRPNRMYYAHCIIWCWMTGVWPELEVDHADLKRSNNRWTNLRLATSSQNAFARGHKSVNRGIELLPNGKYRARIGGRRKKINLGCFVSLEEARTARAKAAKEAFGEFARES